MGNSAASRLTSTFRRTASYNKLHPSRSNEVPREGENGPTDVNNEHTSLLRHPFQNIGNRHLDQDDRAWVKWPAIFAHISYQTLVSSYANIFLVFVPLGIIAGACGWSPTVVFILNFFAIIPLAGLLSFATEELSVKLGETLGGLLNATFGNAVELIVSRKKMLTLGFSG